MLPWTVRPKAFLPILPKVVAQQMIEATSKQDCQRESCHISLSGCPRDMWSFGGKKRKIWHAFFWIRNSIDNQEEFT